MPSVGPGRERLRIVVVHNRYRSAQPSGENLVVEQEADLLRTAGHEVDKGREVASRPGPGAKRRVPA